MEQSYWDKVHASDIGARARYLRTTDVGSCLLFFLCQLEIEGRVEHYIYLRVGTVGPGEEEG